MARPTPHDDLHVIAPGGGPDLVVPGEALVQRLRDAEHLAERLTIALESMTECFFTLDRQWRFTYLNRAAGRVLRQPREALLGRPIWECFPEARGTVFEAHFMRAMHEHAPVEFDAFYVPLEVWVHARAYPSLQGLAVAFRDTSEQVRAQRALLQLNAELEERVQQRTAELQQATTEMEAFAYSVAHDLRAPLAAMNGYGQALHELEGASLSARGRHFLQRMRTAARHMDLMTDGLLALARLSRAALQREVVDLAPVAWQAVALLRERDPGREVDVRIAPDLWAEGDVVLLTQVVTNLVGNAWKFTGRTAQARIEVGMREGEGGEPVYFVRDNGAGFDMAHAGKLFHVFHRLHQPSEFEGTGVGLATVHKIVSRHDGRIWAEAAPGQGATFSFTLGQG